MCSIIYYISLLCLILINQISLVSSNVLLPTSILMLSNNKLSNNLNQDNINNNTKSVSEENPYKLFNISVISWNMAEKMPNEFDCQFIQSYKDNDLIIFGIQECEDIKYRRKEGSRSRKWKEIQLKYLNNFQHISTHKMGGLMLNIYGKKNILKLIQNIQLLEVACGVGNVLTNKGAICILLRFRNKKTIGFINSHFAAHIHKVKQRNLDYHRVLQSITERIPKHWCSSNNKDNNNFAIDINSKDNNKSKKRISNIIVTTKNKKHITTRTSNKLNDIHIKQNNVKINNNNNNLPGKKVDRSKKIIRSETSTNKINYPNHKSLLNKKIKSTKITINKDYTIDKDNNIDIDIDGNNELTTIWTNPIDALIFFGDFNYRNTLPRLEIEYFHRKYQQLTSKYVKNINHPPISNKDKSTSSNSKIKNKAKQNTEVSNEIDYTSLQSMKISLDNRYLKSLFPYSCLNHNEIYNAIENQEDKKCFKELLYDFNYIMLYDQLLKEKGFRNIFAGFQEGPIYFPPTFKYDKGMNKFDSSDKQRCPAWTDRVLYTSKSINNNNINANNITNNIIEDDKYINKVLELIDYYSLNICTSDHRPVCADFKLYL